VVAAVEHRELALTSLAHSHLCVGVCVWPQGCGACMQLCVYVYMCQGKWGEQGQRLVIMGEVRVESREQSARRAERTQSARRVHAERTQSARAAERAVHRLQNVEHG
jgi:hypothetical protein